MLGDARRDGGHREHRRRHQRQDGPRRRLDLAIEQRGIPTLRITDEARSRAFQVTRDGMTFYLSQHVMDCAVGGLIHLFVDSVDDWHAELRRKGVAVEVPPTDQPWGLREMHLVDPDGNRLRICTRLTAPPRERGAGHP